MRDAVGAGLSELLARDRDVIEPRLRGEREPMAELTFSELVELYLERHGKVRSPRTIQTLRERLRRPLDSYGDMPLTELAKMAGELADFRATLPERFARTRSPLASPSLSWPA